MKHQHKLTEAIAEYIYKFRKEHEIDAGDEHSDYSMAEYFLNLWSPQFGVGKWEFLDKWLTEKFFNGDR